MSERMQILGWAIVLAAAVALIALMLTVSAAGASPAPAATPAATSRTLTRPPAAVITTAAG